MYNFLCVKCLVYDNERDIDLVVIYQRKKLIQYQIMHNSTTIIMYSITAGEMILNKSNLQLIGIEKANR